MISHVEHGRRGLLLDGTVKAAQVLGVSLDYLVGLTDDPTPVDERVSEAEKKVREAEDRAQEAVARIRREEARNRQQLEAALERTEAELERLRAEATSLDSLEGV